MEYEDSMVRREELVDAERSLTQANKIIRDLVDMSCLNCAQAYMIGETQRVVACTEADTVRNMVQGCKRRRLIKDALQWCGLNVDVATANPFSELIASMPPEDRLICKKYIHTLATTTPTPEGLCVSVVTGEVYARFWRSVGAFESRASGLMSVFYAHNFLDKNWIISVGGLNHDA
jgi:hypothetical protein